MHPKLLLLALLFLLGSVAAAHASPGLGATAPPIELADADGTQQSLAALRGKVVVVNFWASWCKPCIDEMPLLHDLARRMDG